MNEKVSVIIPVLNRRQLLARCLDSIAAQRRVTSGILEVIVVDNGSTDGSMEAARQWAERNAGKGLEVKVLSEPRAGACHARNKGLGEASGQYTYFFDSDDTMRPGLVERALGAFASRPETGIVCWRCELHLLDGSLRHPAFNPSRPLEDHMINTLLRTQGYMAKTSLLRDIGGWNVNLPGWNDWELGIRLLLRDPVVTAVDEILADIHSQKESITGTDFSSRSGWWEKALRSAADAIAVSGRPDTAHLLRIVAYRETILAAHYARENRPDLADRMLRDSLLHHTPCYGRSTGVLTSVQRLLLRLSYLYTRSGGRGAWHMLRHFL